MAWIKLHTDILDDIKKTRKLSPNSFQIFIFLMLFAKELDTNGEINLDFNDIKWRLRVEEEQLQNGIDDLVLAGILSNKHKVLRFTNWTKRQFSESYERVTKHREKKRYSNANCNGIETDIQNRTEQIRTETEKEKDKKIIASNDKIVFDFSTFTFENITEDFKNRCREAYPAVDIEAEIKKAARWLETHPEKRKKNYARFLTGWFSRTQERGGSVRTSPSATNGSGQEPETFINIDAYHRAKQSGRKDIRLRDDLKSKYEEKYGGPVVNV